MFGGLTVAYQGEQYDFGKRFEPLTLKKAVQRHNPKLVGSDLEAVEKLSVYARGLGIEVKPGYGVGKLQARKSSRRGGGKAPRAQPSSRPTIPRVSPLARCNDHALQRLIASSFSSVGADCQWLFPSLTTPKIGRLSAS